MRQDRLPRYIKWVVSSSYDQTVLCSLIDTAPSQALLHHALVNRVLWPPGLCPRLHVRCSGPYDRRCDDRVCLYTSGMLTRSHRSSCPPDQPLRGGLAPQGLVEDDRRLRAFAVDV
jgi:hypothetical protein